MELRSPERPEPSHIHIPRPSRAELQPADERIDLAIKRACAPEAHAAWTRLH
ncbi:MAG TPA: hypothetical protein VKV73_15155 [Chloroflexota bacterium]|nr:hypothetical protein [Chloroflexota bacterium]